MHGVCFLLSNAILIAKVEKNFGCGNFAEIRGQRAAKEYESIFCQVIVPRLSEVSIGSFSFAVSAPLTSRLVDVLSLFPENDVPSPYEFTVARSTVNILLVLENESRFGPRKLEGSYVIGLNERPFHLVTSRRINTVMFHVTGVCKSLVNFICFYNVVEKLLHRFNDRYKSKINLEEK